MTNNNTSVAIETLLYRNGLSEKDIADAFALFSGYDIDYADFYFQRSVSEGYVLEESIVKTGHYNTDMGVGVRAVCGEKSALAYSEEISRESLFEAVRTVRAIAQATDNQVTVNVTPKDGPKVLYRTVDPIEAADTDAKIKLLRSLDAHARSRSPLITQVTTSVGASHDAILIAKMDGTLIGDIRPLVRVNLGVIAEKDGKKEQGQAGGGGRFALDLYNEEVIEQYAREAVDAAVRNLDARPAPAGSIPVVLGNGWPGVLIHEWLGSRLHPQRHKRFHR
jgi:TldD protein